MENRIVDKMDENQKWLLAFGVGNTGAFVHRVGYSRGGFCRIAFPLLRLPHYADGDRDMKRLLFFGLLVSCNGALLPQ